MVLEKQGEQDSTPRDNKDKKVYSLTLFGQQLEIKTGHSPEYINKIVSYLEEKFASLPSLPFIKKMLLLLLELTDELLQEKEKEKIWEKKLDNLISLISDTSTSL